MKIEKKRNWCKIGLKQVTLTSYLSAFEFAYITFCTVFLPFSSQQWHCIKKLTTQAERTLVNRSSVLPSMYIAYDVGVWAMGMCGTVDKGIGS